MLNVKAPPGMASLAFVFDTTGSMWDDLEKVKRGAQRILMSAIKRKVQPLFNYIFGILNFYSLIFTEIHFKLQFQNPNRTD